MGALSTEDILVEPIPRVGVGEGVMVGVLFSAVDVGDGVLVGTSGVAVVVLVNDAFAKRVGVAISCEKMPGKPNITATHNIATAAKASVPSNKRRFACNNVGSEVREVDEIETFGRMSE